MVSAGNGARAHFARARIVCRAPCTEFISTESFGRAARAGAKRSDDHRGIDIGNRLCGVYSHPYTLCILHVLAFNHQPMCMCMAGAISLREMERTPGFGRLPMMVCSALPPGCIAAPAELMSGLELEHEDTGDTELDNSLTCGYKSLHTCALVPARTHARTHARMHARTHICTHIQHCTHTHTHTRTHAHAHTREDAHAHMHTCIYHMCNAEPESNLIALSQMNANVRLESDVSKGHVKTILPAHSFALTLLCRKEFRSQLRPHHSFAISPMMYSRR